MLRSIFFTEGPHFRNISLPKNKKKLTHTHLYIRHRPQAAQKNIPASTKARCCVVSFSVHHLTSGSGIRMLSHVFVIAVSPVAGRRGLARWCSQALQLVPTAKNLHGFFFHHSSHWLSVAVIPPDFSLCLRSARESIFTMVQEMQPSVAYPLVSFLNSALTPPPLPPSVS